MYSSPKKFRIENLVERLIRETENRIVVWDVKTYPTMVDAEFTKKITDFKKLKISISYNYKYDYNAYLSINFISKNFILYTESFGVTDNHNIKVSLKKLVALILKMEEEDRQI